MLAKVIFAALSIGPVWYVYLRTVGGCSSPARAWAVMRQTLQTGYQQMYTHTHRAWLRSKEFPLVQNPEPFEQEVRKLHRVAYIQYQSCRSVDPDILEVSFCLLGLQDTSEEGLQATGILLGRLLQDFYIQRCGYSAYPLVLTKVLREGEAVFWIAKNAYGNQRIQAEQAAARRREQPHQEELKDD